MNPKDSQNTTFNKPSDRKPEKGAAVDVVLADGTFAPAEIIKVGRDGEVDLKFACRGEEIVITSSPYDPVGRKGDSWRWAVENSAPSKARAGGDGE